MWQGESFYRGYNDAAAASIPVTTQQQPGFLLSNFSNARVNSLSVHLFLSDITEMFWCHSAALMPESNAFRYE